MDRGAGPDGKASQERGVYARRWSSRVQFILSTGIWGFGEPNRVSEEEPTLMGSHPEVHDFTISY